MVHCVFGILILGKTINRVNFYYLNSMSLKIINSKLILFLIYRMIMLLYLLVDNYLQLFSLKNKCN